MSHPSPGSASATVYCEIGGLPVEVVAEDLGATGLFARTTTPARLESEVEIFLRSPAGAVTLRGHVVQVIDVQRAAVEHRAPGYGVLFSHVSAQARAWIDATRVSPPPSPAHATPRPEVSAQRTPAPNSHATPTPGAATSSTPTPARPPRVDPRVAATLAVLEQELESARGKAPWLLLGIEKDASPDVARNAFLDASRRYHPHRFARYDSDEVTRVATELFLVHKRAFASLAPESGRPKRPDSGPWNVSDAGSERSPDEVTRQRFVDPKAALAAGLKHLSIGRLVECRKALEQALELDPSSKQARLWLLVCEARALAVDGEPELAHAKYAEALAIDPTHREALRETGGGGDHGGPTRRLRK